MTDTRTYQTAQGPVTLSVYVDPDLAAELSKHIDDAPKPPEDFIEWKNRQAAAFHRKNRP